ncbi:TetR/AcrR family transcriptional regulator [Alkalihalobacillus sp. TS-13]|uniref:TetR/AcrR family transcriptional regulator n=1 Tax=Alkalihalobacillus sp. TS-13 TaxID=2842455 RepID=UPI001C86E12D|nr:TetR/AcrR family transcriptional regulator [Alkalihalobacillus sp. TS-13]
MPTRSRLNQDIITEKALEIADLEGMDFVTMANIARELSIKPPSLYNHFKSLEDIKQAMAVQALKLFNEHLYKAAENKENGQEKIREIGKAYVTFAHRYPGFYEASLSAPDPTAENVRFYGESIVNLTKEALTIYALNEKEMIHIIRGIRSLLHGLVDLEKRGGFNLEVDLTESLNAILETYIKGIGR